MIDRIILGHAHVVAGANRGGTDMRGEAGVRLHGIVGHVARLVVRRLEAVVDTDGEDRQVVEKERVEMISVEHHDQVRPRGGKLLLLRTEQLRDLAIGSVALDEMRENRGMRYAETSDDLRHFELPALGDWLADLVDLHCAHALVVSFDIEPADFEAR